MGPLFHVLAQKPIKESLKSSISQKKHKDLRHYIAMKHRRSAGLLLSLCVLLTSASAALAHETTSPSPTSAPLSELDQYKHDLDHYRVDMNLREQVRKEISKAFVAAIKAARNINAKTLGAANQRDKAIADAILTRDQALEAMGPAPIEPTKPDKPVATAMAKKTKTSKPSSTPTP